MWLNGHFFINPQCTTCLGCNTQWNYDMVPVTTTLQRFSCRRGVRQRRSEASVGGTTVCAAEDGTMTRSKARTSPCTDINSFPETLRSWRMHMNNAAFFTATIAENGSAKRFLAKVVKPVRQILTCSSKSILGALKSVTLKRAILEQRDKLLLSLAVAFFQVLSSFLHQSHSP